MADTSATSGGQTDGSDATGSTGSATGASTGVDVDCGALDAAECTGDCQLVSTFAASAAVCGVDLSASTQACVASAGPIGKAPTTYYAEVDGELRFLVHAQPCVETTETIVPEGWTECSGAADDPEPCTCLCGSEGCPPYADLQLLQSCGLAESCGEPVVTRGATPGPYQECVMQALRDRTPGAYASLSAGLSPRRWDLFVEGEQVQVVVEMGSDLCFSAVPDVAPTQTCTLQPPAFFDACLADPGDGSCMYADAWLVDCVDQPAECP